MIACFGQIQLFQNGHTWLHAEHSLLFKYFKRFCLTCNIDWKYGEKKYDLLFSRIIEYSPSVSGDVNDIIEMNNIANSCSVKITPMTSIFKHIWKNKPPFPTNVYDDVRTSLNVLPLDILFEY